MTLVHLADTVDNLDSARPHGDCAGNHIGCDDGDVGLAEYGMCQ